MVSHIDASTKLVATLGAAGPARSRWDWYRPPMDGIRERYLHFAETEACGSSPTYERLARGVAETPSLQAFLAAFPAPKQQPNLLFGAVRHLGMRPTTAADLARIIQDRGEEVAAIMRSRATQTNEPARCASLLPALARLPQPLALLEVGASAGLCLLPDRYAYDYGRRVLRPDGAEADETPVFACAACADTPLPERLPHVVWRAGIDLAPIDVDEGEAVSWLRALIWPEHEVRAANFARAIEIARREPPVVYRGNLLTRLEEVAATAPEDATLVIFHTAVLVYLSPAQRVRFVDLVRGLRATWVSNEAPGVVTFDAMPESVPPRSFLLAVDGVPIAWTGHHGQSITWLAKDGASPGPTRSKP